MNRAEMEAFIKEYLEGVRKAKKQLEDFEPEIQRLHNKAIKIQENLDKILPTTQEHANTITRSLNEILPATQGHANTITQSLDKLLPTAQTHAGKIKNLIDNEAANIKEHTKKTKTSISDQLKEASPLISEIKKYHSSLLTDTKDKNGKIVPSIKTSIEDYIKDQRGEFNKIHGDLGSVFTQLRNDLEAEIRSLLPEAGAAGLSSAYFEAKTRYGAVPYKKLTDNNTADETTWAIPNSVWRFIGTNIKGVVFYTLFILPLIVIIYLMVNNSIGGLNDLIKDDGTLNPNALLRRFFISSPFAMLSWFGWGSIRLNRRLYEEYNHKQRVMQLYHSFKKEVEVEGTDKQKQELLTIMLNNVGDKPSIAVHSGKEQNEKISFFGGMMVITRPIKKLSDNDSDPDDTDDTPEPTPVANKKPKK